jgi:outer membrane beta-barrel protein
MSKFALFSAVLALNLAQSAKAEDAPPPPAASSSTSGESTETPAAESSAGSSNKTPLDASVRIGSDDEVSNVFRDMGVVQRKAMRKRGRFLVSTYGTLDFSDGPYTNYSLSINPGFAISDFLEVYAQFSPLYIVNKRSIVDLVSGLTLQGGQQATITAARPKYQYGIEVLWAPLYGKDSLGTNTILRSDTFLKFGASQIQYDTTKGVGFKLGVGKTFFLGKYMGLRFCIDYGYIQSVINEEKSFKGVLLSELGVNFYL